MSLDGKHILIIFTPREMTPYFERVSDVQMEAMVSALKALHVRVTLLQFYPECSHEITEHAFDGIFNLAYGWTDGKTTLFQPEVAEIIEQHGAILGSTSTVQRIVQDKRLSGELLTAEGVNVPKEDWSYQTNHPRVVKPRKGACHRDVVVVPAGKHLQHDTYLEQDWVCQHYIEGMEFTVAVLESGSIATPLTPVYIAFDEGVLEHPIMDWNQIQWSYKPAQGAIAQALQETALRAYHVLGMRHYARFDLKCTPDGKIVVLDANALPNLDPEVSLFPLSAQFAGMTYADTIQRLAAALLT